MIEPLITKLVQDAPALADSDVTALRDALWSDGRPLALAIGRVLELVAEHLVDAGIALPALAEACATLVASKDPKVLEAARYQVETLVPKPDVPLSHVRRRQT
ncbi:MAG TPA: hypothetical protein VGF94_26115 [Kofleriaceae bacterium]